MSKDPVFVFGSNLSGRHGKGAALHAMKHYGARYGEGQGYHGNSYAIPTKDSYLKTLPVSIIAGFVKTFFRFAEANINLNFYVTGIGTGLAGYNIEDIAPLFANAPMNVELCLEFQGWLDRRAELDSIPHGENCLCFFCIGRAKDGKDQRGADVRGEGSVSDKG